MLRLVLAPLYSLEDYCEVGEKIKNKEGEREIWFPSTARQLWDTGPHYR